MKQENILVGHKPLMSYVSAVTIQFIDKEVDSVVIKARGKFIGKAIDIALVATDKLLKDLVKLNDDPINMCIKSETTPNDKRVSAIEITLVKI